MVPVVGAARGSPWERLSEQGFLGFGPIRFYIVGAVSHSDSTPGISTSRPIFFVLLMRVVYHLSTATGGVRSQYYLRRELKLC